MYALAPDANRLKLARHRSHLLPELVDELHMRPHGFSSTTNTPRTTLSPERLPHRDQNFLVVHARPPAEVHSGRPKPIMPLKGINVAWGVAVWLCRPRSERGRLGGERLANLAPHRVAGLVDPPRPVRPFAGPLLADQEQNHIGTRDPSSTSRHIWPPIRSSIAKDVRASQVFAEREPPDKFSATSRVSACRYDKNTVGANFDELEPAIIVVLGVGHDHQLG